MSQSPPPPLPPSAMAPPPPPAARLVDIEINSENQALNLLVSFLGLAQRRGAFGLDEAAKIFECVKVFQKPAMPTTNTVLPPVDECCESTECPTGSPADCCTEVAEASD